MNFKRTQAIVFFPQNPRGPVSTCMMYAGNFMKICNN